MSLKKATPVEIIDGNSFRLRTDAIIVLEGVEAPDKTTPEGQKAKEKLSELVLKKRSSTRQPSGPQWVRPRQT